MSPNFFFDSWPALAKALLAAPILYALVVAGVRLTGKRTTGQMNNFDWIVTVAMGSITASGIVIDDVSLSEAGGAIAVLLALQWAITRLTLRSGKLDDFVKAEPALLVHEGRLLKDAMRRERITKDEVVAKLRGKGIAKLSDVSALILENDGTFSVLRRDDTQGAVDDDVLPEALRRP